MSVDEQNEACLFCAIAAGETAAHLVFESDDVIAFLDIGPIRPGHVQIVPRRHFAYFDDLPISLLTAVAAVAQRIAKAQKLLYGVERAALVFTGDDIPHAHAHVLPMLEGTDITSRRYIANKELEFRSMPRLSEAEMAKIATELRTLIDQP